MCYLTHAYIKTHLQQLQKLQNKAIRNIYLQPSIQNRNFLPIKAIKDMQATTFAHRNSTHKDHIDTNFMHNSGIDNHHKRNRNNLRVNCRRTTTYRNNLSVKNKIIEDPNKFHDKIKYFSHQRLITIEELAVKVT